MNIFEAEFCQSDVYTKNVTLKQITSPEISNFEVDAGKINSYWTCKQLLHAIHLFYLDHKKTVNFNEITV